MPSRSPSKARSRSSNRTRSRSSNRTRSRSRNHSPFRTTSHSPPRARSRSVHHVLSGPELQRVQNLVRGTNFNNFVKIPNFFRKYCKPIGDNCVIRGGQAIGLRSAGVRQWHQNNVPSGYMDGGRFKRINKSVPFHPDPALSKHIKWPATVMMVYPHGASVLQRTQFKQNQATFEGTDSEMLENLPPGAMVVHSGSNVHRAPNGNTPQRLAFAVDVIGSSFGLPFHNKP